MKIRVRITVAGVSPFDWSFDGPQFVVGRDPNCELSFKPEQGKAVSWQHARFNLGGSAPEITDLASTNGVFVNGVQASRPVSLKVGDVVMLGREGPRLDILAIRAAEPVPTVAAGPSSAQAQPAAEPARAPANPPPAAASAFDERQHQRRQTLLFAGTAGGITAIVGLIAWLSGGTRQAEGPAGSVAPVVSAPLPPPPRPESLPPQDLPKPPEVRQWLPADEVVRKYKPAVVWIGIERPTSDGDVIRNPIVSGWASAAREIVTSGISARFLASFQKQDAKAKIFAVVETGPGQFEYRYVTGIALHPGLAATAKENEALHHHNIGKLTLDKPLPATCVAAAAADMAVTMGPARRTVYVAGYSISSELQLSNAIPSAVPFTIQQFEIGDPLPAPADVQFPLSVLKPKGPAPDMSGSPVLDLEGRVIGTLIHTNQDYIVYYLEVGRLIR